MKREFARLIVILGVSASVILGYATLKKFYAQAKIKQQVSQLGALDMFEALDGEILPYRSWNDADKPVIILFFKTKCPYCVAELSDILTHSQLLDQNSIFIISEEPDDVLKTFKKEHNLEGDDSINFLRDPSGMSKTWFGIKGVPTTFIYDNNREMIESISGRVKVEYIQGIIDDSGSTI